MAVRNKYGGYRNKTRSMADSGGLSMYSAGLVQQKNTPDNKSSPIVPHHAIPDITVPTETGDKLTPTQGKGFLGFLSGMHVRYMRMITITRVCLFPTARKST